MASAETKAILERIDVATDNIAVDVRTLTAKVGTGMTEAEVAEVNTLAEAVATKLETIAADTDDPVPDA